MTLLSLTPQTLLLAAALPLLTLIIHARRLQNALYRNGEPLRRAPGSLPLLGNALRFLRPRHDLLTWFVSCERAHPHETLQISVPTVGRGVIVSSPENVEYVLRNEGVFAKGDFVKSRSWDLFGHGIINADGELWRAQRKAGLAFLSAANLRVLTEDVLPRYLHASVMELRARTEADGPVDMQAVFHEITTRLMGKMAYGMDMRADDDFTLAFEYASGATAERFQNPLWRVTEFFFGWRLRRSIALIKEHGTRIVQHAKKALDEDKPEDQHGEDHRSGEISGSLVKSLLQSIPDDQLVADAALNYLSAGRDTTAQALTWALHLLTRHPEDADRVREEARYIISETFSSPGVLPSSECRPASVPYTLAAFYEALRLYPPIPVEIKQTTAPATLPDGTYLPPNTVVMWCPWSMNRSLKTWGPDADSFRPSRWLSSPSPPSPGPTPNVPNGDSGPPKARRFVNRSVGEFPVFNGGPRICLGKKMAEIVGVQVLASMVWHFDFEDADVRAGKAAEKRTPSSLTLPMEGGLPCYVRGRPDAMDPLEIVYGPVPSLS